MKRPPVLCDNLTCTGCWACKSICPTNAIKMQYDNEGFMQPIVNSQTCINCLKCEVICPVISQHKSDYSLEPETYAAWHKNDEIRLSSTSGGIFIAFAESIINDGGIVFGAAYDKNMKVRHIKVDTLSELYKLQGSKYVQSEIGNCFIEAKSALIEGKKVLFSGTPCQISGLNSFLRKKYDSLLTVDFICHGVPSPLLFKKYTDKLQSNIVDKIIGIDFRNKKNGWENSVTTAKLENTKQIVLKGKKNSFYHNFIKGYSLRQSCFDCPSIGIPRRAMITIADFWGIDKSEPITNEDVFKGISLLMINDLSVKHDILNNLSQNAILYKTELQESIKRNPHVLKPSAKPKLRDEFFTDLNKSSYTEISDKYFHPSLKEKFVAFVKENLGYRFVFILRILKKK